MTTFGLLRGLPMDISDLEDSHTAENAAGLLSEDSFASAADTEIALAPEEDDELNEMATTMAASFVSLPDDVAASTVSSLASASDAMPLSDATGDGELEALPCSSSFLPCEPPPPPPLRLARLPSCHKLSSLADLRTTKGPPAAALRNLGRSLFDAAALPLADAAGVPLGDAAAFAHSLCAAKRGRTVGASVSVTVDDLRSRCLAARGLTAGWPYA